MPSISRAETQRVLKAWHERKYMRANMTHTYTLGCNFDEPEPWVILRLNPNMHVIIEGVYSVRVMGGFLCFFNKSAPLTVPIRG